MKICYAIIVLAVSITVFIPVIDGKTIIYINIHVQVLVQLNYVYNNFFYIYYYRKCSSEE